MKETLANFDGYVIDAAQYAKWARSVPFRGPFEPVAPVFRAEHAPVPRIVHFQENSSF